MISDNKELDVAPASQPPLSHPSGAEPASAVSGKTGIANAFTPGPWHRRVNVDNSVIRIEPASNLGEEVVAYVTKNTLREILDGSLQRDDGANFANARLIAAAPDLYEQVELFVRVIEYNIRVAENKGDDEGARLQSLTLAMARAALAKALAA